DPVFKFSGVVLSSTQLTTDISADTSTATLPDSVVSSITVNRDLLRYRSSRTIPAAKQRYGFVAKPTRKVSTTIIDHEAVNPCYFETTTDSSTTYTVTAVDSSAYTITCESLIGTSGESIKYRMQFVTLGGADASAVSPFYPAYYDADTGTWYFDSDYYPTDVTANDTFYIYKYAEVDVVQPCYVDIRGVTFEKDLNFAATNGAHGFTGLYIYLADSPYIENVGVKGFEAAGMLFEHCYKPFVYRIDASYANRAYNGYDGHGYGVNFSGCFAGRAYHITGFANRREFDCGGSQVTSFYTDTYDIVGAGGGLCYNGTESFYPLGSFQSTVNGSHENAFFSTYRETRGIDKYGVINTRGMFETVDGLHVTGLVNNLANCFIGTVPKFNNITYSNESGKTTAINGAASIKGSLSAGIQVHDSYLAHEYPIEINNVNVTGIIAGLLSIVNGQSVSDISITSAVCRTYQGDTTNPFYLIRASGTGTPTINGQLRTSGIQIYADPNATSQGQHIIQTSYFDIGTEFIHVQESRTFVFELKDDSAISFDLPTNKNQLAIDIWPAQTNRQIYANGVLIGLGLGRQYSSIGSSGYIEYGTTALTGTTGTDAVCTVSALTESGRARIYFENRLGSTTKFCIHIKYL
ncbi:MAG: hypothetical protein QM666_04460, partial [Acinetobacter sp.]